jgi:hypothetical protein
LTVKSWTKRGRLRSLCCTQNDRQDNSTNIRYEGYQKPYFTTARDGSLVLQNQPVPKSRLQYIKEDWLVRNLWLARVAAVSYVKIRHPCPGPAVRKQYRPGRDPRSRVTTPSHSLRRVMPEGLCAGRKGGTSLNPAAAPGDHRK